MLLKLKNKFRDFKYKILQNELEKTQRCQSFGKKNTALPIIRQKKPQLCKSFDKKNRSTANHLANLKPQHCKSFDKKTAALPIIWHKKPQHSKSFGAKNRSTANHLTKKPQHCQSFGKKKRSTPNDLETKTAALSMNWNKTAGSPILWPQNTAFSVNWQTQLPAPTKNIFDVEDLNPKPSKPPCQKDTRTFAKFKTEKAKRPFSDHFEHVWWKRGRSW